MVRVLLSLLTVFSLVLLSSCGKKQTLLNTAVLPSAEKTMVEVDINTLKKMDDDASKCYENKEKKTESVWDNALGYITGFVVVFNIFSVLQEQINRANMEAVGRVPLQVQLENEQKARIAWAEVNARDRANYEKGLLKRNAYLNLQVDGLNNEIVGLKHVSDLYRQDFNRSHYENTQLRLENARLRMAMDD
ncbi:hypothetical protein AGMMS5026_05590 [Endomicrobiia bacterium]|nr:hypothetical protein AGMMS49523_08870 [Endomicrobiia bacterium]GHT14049.1 hypothetical protein AGMMS49571_08930 [Endomicrobiia bacterium]GHT21524.1 hypothetical protein AGMMS49929_10150 [Endomicrobiia bacterium]GHT27964.1 hypothetical protein AGMMS49995_07950 [Endomicrobiia bacterium]GHT30697.1 hypothetical protein AGMMS5026_05590 [Endomicrobiia bacterium]